MKKATLVLLVFSSLVLAGCLSLTSNGEAPSNEIEIDAPAPYDDAEVAFVVDGEERGQLDVEIAETRSERSQGLMGRESLPEGTGMLFVYGGADVRAFWMKNTLVPLDIIFVDSDRRVVNVKHASPEPDTPDHELTRYTSDGPAQYVVEAERGYANETGISPGDELVIRR